MIRQPDSALPDASPEPGTGPIAAIESDNVGSFARDLRSLRAQAGLDYPDMAEKSHYTMRTLASAAGGLRMPTLPVLIAYVRACDGDQAEWEERWSKLMRDTGSQAALPAAGADTATEAAPAVAETRAQEVYVITSAPARDDRR
ncbi:MAG: helix-turn-helix domain-containing protein [Nocardiopsaceae bacterium]|nr:helix-turn-helix domain-containing protein [Nocardiopsaceae bacterium]